jgi:hypothetical protein
MAIKSRFIRIAREQDRRIKDAIANPEKYGLATACTLCGAPPAFTGVFIAGEQFGRLIGAAQGETYIELYCLCSQCRELSDKQARIERKLLAERSPATDLMKQ